jgi:hypothetical protein
VVKFTKKHITCTNKGQPTYLSTDSFRNMFKYKDENGFVRKDIKTNNNKETDNMLSNNSLTILTNSFLKVKNIGNDVDFAKELSVALTN